MYMFKAQQTKPLVCAMSGAGHEQVEVALARLGSCGPHQLLMLSLLALVYATNAVYNVNYVFAVEDVGYRYGCVAVTTPAPPCLLASAASDTCSHVISGPQA